MSAGSGRVFGYARVSTDGQAENTSLRVQRERLKAWATAQGGALDACFEDVASGATLHRPGLDELRALLAPGDSVVVMKLDRLSRSIVDAEPLISEWERRGIRLASVSEPIETGSAMGRAMLRMILVFAQSEREVIAERMASGKTRNAADGKFNGSPVPFGYRRGQHGERDFEPVPEEAATVRELFRRFATGRYGVRRLRRATGCPLSESGISDLLSNPFYTGRIRYGGLVRFNDHERLVSDRLFNRAQRVKQSRVKSPAVRYTRLVENQEEMVPLS